MSPSDTASPVRTQSGEDAVGGRDHVGTRQDDNVERVGNDAEDADDAGQVAMATTLAR